MLAAAIETDLSRIVCPVLLIIGDQDRIAPWEIGRPMASAIRGAERKVLDGCGHWATIERGKHLNFALSLFLSRMRPSAAA